MASLAKVCERCGVVHKGPPFNLQKILDKATKAMSEDINRQVMEELLKQKVTK